VTLKILLHRKDSIDVLYHLVEVGHFGDFILKGLDEGDDEGVGKAAEFNHIYIYIILKIGVLNVTPSSLIRDHKACVCE
jgi:hypothetical protein